MSEFDSRPLVAIESAYAGDVAANEAFARRAMRDSLERGEFPIASHLLYTQEGILDDDAPDERTLGIEAGFAWANYAERTVVYLRPGEEMSYGTKAGVERAERQGRPVEIRVLEEEPAATRPECHATITPDQKGTFSLRFYSAEGNFILQESNLPEADAHARAIELLYHATREPVVITESEAVEIKKASPLPTAIAPLPAMRLQIRVVELEDEGWEQKPGSDVRGGVWRIPAGATDAEIDEASLIVLAHPKEEHR